LGFPAEMTRRASMVPTRLTRFRKETRALLLRAGYAHTDAALRASRIKIPNPRPPSFDGLPDVK
jgi:NTE family protein